MARRPALICSILALGLAVMTGCLLFTPLRIPASGDGVANRCTLLDAVSNSDARGIDCKSLFQDRLDEAASTGVAAVLVGGVALLLQLSFRSNEHDGAAPGRTRDRRGEPVPEPDVDEDRLDQIWHDWSPTTGI